MSRDKVAMIKRALKKGDLGHKIVCSIFMYLGFSNEKLQELEIRNKKYKILKKKYNKYLQEIDYDSDEQIDKPNNKIWICWLQGLDNAPEIVKACVNSIYTFCPDNDIKIITLDNLFNYVNFPNYIIEKWKKGIITNTHFSDMIRTELLINYGGLWLDATTFLMAPLPKYIYRENFFVYSFKIREDISIKVNSWFIYSEKGNRLLKVTRDLLYKYWENENRLKEYFLWHLFMSMAIDKYPEDFKKIPKISDEIAHMLGRSLTNEFSQDYWNDILSISSIQKLTYKLNTEDLSNSFYDYILDLKEGSPNGD